MSMMTKDKGGDFTPIPAGTHLAICVAMIDIGLQASPYGDKEQLIAMFETPNELIEEGDFKGQPMIVSKFYTNSLNEKANLRKDLEAWRGKAFSGQELDGFFLKNILGAPCMISVVHKDRKGGGINAVVESVIKIVKGQDVPAPVHPCWFYDLDDPDVEVYEQLPEWVQKKICGRVSGDWNAEQPPIDETTVGSNDDFDDDIPF